MTIVTLSHCHTSRFGGILGKELFLGKELVLGKELEEVIGELVLKGVIRSYRELDGVRGQ